MKLRNHFSSLIALSLFAACSTELDRSNPRDIQAPADLQAKAAVTGTITLEGEEDHGGTEIRLEGPGTQDISTKADGSFSLNRILPGKYTVTVSQRGWEEVTIDNVDLGIGVKYNFGGLKLVLHKAQVTGTISTPDSSLVQSANTLVELSRTAGPRDVASGAPAFYPQALSSASFKRLFRYRAAAASDGSFQFDNVAAGKYKVLVTKAGSAPIAQEMTVGADDVSISMGDIPLRPLTGRLKIVGKLAGGTNSEKYTVQETVTLELDGFNASKMKLGDLVNNVCTYGNEEAYAATRQYSLPAGDGVKTICVRYINEVGEETEDITGQIILDQTPPDLSFVRLNGGVAASADKTVVLEAVGIDQTSGLARIRWIRNNQSLGDFDFVPSWSDTVLHDGTYTYTVRFEDAAGNVSTPKAAMVVIDSAIPVIGQFVVNGALPNASPGAVTVIVQGVDTNLTAMKLWVDNEAAATYGPYVTSTSVLIPAVDGPHTVGIKLRDTAGNESASQTFVLNVDSTPPTFASISINAGASATNSTSVQLTLGATGANFVRVSESPTFGDASWQATAGTLAFTLSSGDGAKTVYAQFKDAAGNLGDLLSDGILLDATPPSGVSVIVDGNNAYNTDTAGQFNLNINGIDVNGVTQMRVMSTNAADCVGVGAFANAPYNASIVYPYANAGAGIEETARVCVMVSDAAGNWSSAVSDTIEYDTKVPTVTAFVLDGGNDLTTALSVTAYTAADAGTSLMKLSTGAGCASGSWEPLNGIKTVSLSEGNQSLSVMVKDAAGNSSTCYADAITVDSLGPNTPTITSTSAALTNDTSVSINLSASGADFVEIAEDVGFFSQLYNGATVGSTTVTVAAGDGTRTLYARFSDAAGNQSGIASATLTLDQTPPSGVAVQIDAGNAYNADAAGQFNLMIGGTDVNGVSLMRVMSTNAADCAGIGAFANAPYNASIVHAYANAGAGVEETARVCVMVSDAAGNWSAAVSDTISYDTQAPTAGGPAITLNSGASVTNQTAVNATILATGADEMQVSVDSGFAGASWQAYNTSGSVIVGSGDGSKTVYVRFRDLAGNTTLGSNDTINLDRTAPTGVALTGPTSSNAYSVNLNLSASDTNGPIEVRLSEDPAFGSASWSVFGSPRPFTTSSSDGLHTIYGQYRDGAGNLSQILQYTLSIDTAAPTNESLSIQQGTYTQTQSITVVMGADDADEVQLSENAGFGGATWLPISLTRTFTLSATETTHTVYARYRDLAGNPSGTTSASIILDSTNPNPPSVTINGGASGTGDRQVSVQLAYDADVVEMQLSESSGFAGASWLSVTSDALYTLTAGDGAKTIFARVQDASGRLSSNGNDSITLDETPPLTPSVGINSGASTANNPLVSLVLGNQSGATQMIIGDDPGFATKSWETVASNKSYTLPTGDGVKVVYVLYRDTVSNTSGVGSASIVLDTGAPSAAQVVVNSSAQYSTSKNLTLTLFSSGAVTMRVAEDTNFSGSVWVSYASSYAYTITTAGEGTKTIYVEFADGAANVTGPVTDAIVYDGTKPSAGTGVSINSGVTYTNSSEVVVTLDVPADATGIIVADNTGFAGASWQSVTQTVSWNVGAGDGTKTVYARWRDAAGNKTAVQSDTILLDTTAPSPNSPAITIAGNAQYSTATTILKVHLDASGADSMIVSEDQGLSSPLYSGSYLSDINVPSPATDGTYTLYVQFSDTAGNDASTRSDSVILDRTAPALGDAVFNSDNRYTKTGDVQVQLFGYDDNPLKWVELSEDDFVTVDQRPYSPSLSYTLLAAQNVDTIVKVRIVDAAGNASSALTSQTLTYDKTPPTPGIPQIRLNGGALWATDALLRVVLNPGDADEFQLGNNPGFAGSQWQPVTDETVWNLPTGDGYKEVWIRYRDAAGNDTVAAMANITLDTQAPTNVQVLLGLNGLYTNTRSISVDLLATDAYSFAISTDIGFGKPVTGDISGGFTTATLQLPSADGFQTVYGIFYDEAGNRSPLAQDSIILDTTPPELYDLAINNYADYANDRWLNLRVDAWDVNPITYAVMDTTATFSGTATAEDFYNTNLVYYNPVTGQSSTVYVQVIDMAGNQSTVTSASIFIDITAPTGILNIDTPVLTNDRNVSFYFTGEPGDVEEYQANESGWPTASAWKPLGDVETLTIGNTEGPHTIHVWMRDAAKNESPEYTAIVTLDTNAPNNVRLLINGGMPITATTAVTLTLGALDTGDVWSQPLWMRLANDAGFNGASWQAATTTTNWTLDAEGTQFVYAQWRDPAGNLSPVAQASIVVDETAPDTVDILIDGDAAKTADPLGDVTLSLFAADNTGGSGIVGVRIANSAAAVSAATPQPYEQTKPWVLTGPSGAGVTGTRTVCAMFHDYADNRSPVVCDTIEFDRLGPSGTIAFWNLITNDVLTGVDLTYDADTTDMKLSGGSTCAGGSWVGITDTTLWNLAQVDGDQSVSVRFRDDIGNEGGCFSDSIRVDTRGPLPASFSITGNVEAQPGYSNTVNLVLNWSSTAADCDYIEMSEDVGFINPTDSNANCSNTNYAYSLATTADGLHTVYARFYDTLGNVGAVIQAFVVLDSTAPQTSVQGFQIAEGNLTSQQEINISFDGTGASEVRLSETNCSNGVWQPYASSLTYDTGSFDGTILWESIPDASYPINGNWDSWNNTNDWLTGNNEPSPPYAAYLYSGTAHLTSPDISQYSNVSYSFYYQREPATYRPGIGDYLKMGYVNAGSDYELESFDYVSGSTSYFNFVSGMLPVTAEALKFWRVEAGGSDIFLIDDILLEGNKSTTLYVQYRDVAGNLSACFSQQVTRDVLADALPAMGMSLVGVESRNDLTASQGVGITLSGVDSDVVYMKISNLSNFGDATWVPIDTAFNWLLPSGDGLKTVYIMIRDGAGNVTDISSSISLDQTPPDPPSIQVADIDGDGFALSNTTIELQWTIPVSTNKFELQRFVVGTDSDYQRIAYVGGAVNTTATTVEVTGSTHKYRIRAIDEIGNLSGWSLDTITVPFKAIDKLHWLRGTDGYTMEWQPQKGTFSLGIDYYYDDLTGQTYLQTLSPNSTRWVRPWLNQLRFNERLSIRANNQDNSLVYQSIIPLDISRRETVAIGIDRNTESALALGPDQSVHISYQDKNSRDVWYGRLVAGSWIMEVASSSADSLGYYQDLLIDSNGKAHIAYYNYTGKHLEYATNKSGTWVSQVVDATSAWIGSDISINIDSSGRIHIIYYDQTNTRIRHAVDNGAGGWLLYNALSVNASGIDSTIDKNDNIHLCYRAVASSGRLDYAVGTGGSFVSQIAYAGSDSGWNCSIKVDASNKVHIAHYHRSTELGLRYTTLPSGGTWTSEIVNTNGDVGKYSSLGIDAAGQVHIVYYGTDLIYSLLSSGGWQTWNLDTEGAVGTRPSLAVEPSGRIHATYFDLNNDDLKYLNSYQLAPVTSVVVSGAGYLSSISDLQADASGKLHVAFSNGTTPGKIEYSHNMTGPWSRETACSQVGEVAAPSLQMDNSGKAHLTYTYVDDGEIYYASNSLGTWNCELVEAAIWSEYSSLALDATNVPHVIYNGVSGTDRLLYAKKPAGTWLKYTLDSDATAGNGGFAKPVLKIGSDGIFHVVYQDTKNGLLKYATGATGPWSVSTLPIYGTIDWGGFDMALDANNKMHISYNGGTNRDLIYMTNRSGSWEYQVVETLNNIGLGSSIFVDPSGFAHITHYDQGTIADFRYSTNISGNWVSSILKGATSTPGRTSGLNLSENKDIAVVFSGGSPKWEVEFAGYMSNEIPATTIARVSPF